MEEKTVTQLLQELKKWLLAEARRRKSPSYNKYVKDLSMIRNLLSNDQEWHIFFSVIIFIFCYHLALSYEVRVISQGELTA